MTGSPDILAEIEDALAEARAHAVVVVDRAEALAELRSLALERAAELGTPTLTAEQFENGLTTEQKRAEFTALARRAATDDERETSRAA